MLKSPTKHAPGVPRFLASSVLLVATTTVGCGDDTSTNAPDCFMGEERSCTAKSGCVGVRICYSDGWGECSCDVTSADAGAPDSGTTAHPPLGGACSADAECPTGAMCLLPTSTAWFGGAPPKGLCVADCTNDVTVCAAFEAATCVSSDPEGAVGVRYAFCLPSCNLTTGTTGVVNCSNVSSSACDVLKQQSLGFCRPFCARDSDCPSGHCDRRYGSCVANALPASAVTFGQRCDPNAPNCDGVCVDLSNGYHVCTQRCTMGNANECATEIASPTTSACSYAATASPRPGNVGYAAPLCDCNDDCAAAGLVCRGFSETDTQSCLGRSGMCYPPVDADGKSEAGVACE